MPTGCNPTPSGNDNGGVIELQCQDGGPTDCRSSHNASSIPTPGKMLLPGLLPRMEQRYKFPGERVNGLNLVRLKLIASATSQTDIFKPGRSAARQRQNMVKRESNPAIDFLSQTIRATSAIMLLNLGFEVNRNVSRHNQSDLRNLMSPPAQQGRCLSFTEHEAICLGAKLS